MPKLRSNETADLDVRELDDAEYSEDEYESYEGDIPPVGTELNGYLKSLWWCRTQKKDDGSGQDPMLKALWIAADNDGDLEQYNGLPIWENAVLTPAAKFRWAGFLRAFGITIKAIKTSTYLDTGEVDERMNGALIERIGKFHPGEDHDEAWSRVVTDRHRYQDEWSARAKKWLPWEDEEDEEEEPEDVTDEADDEADEEPDEDEEYDEDEEEGEDEDEEDEDEDEEPEPPARTRRTSRTSAKAPAASARGSRTASKARSAPASRTTRSASGKAGGARTASRTASSGRSRTKAGAGTKPAGRTRGRKASAETDDEPPF